MKKIAILLISFVGLACSINAQDTVYLYDTLNPACPTEHYMVLARTGYPTNQILATRTVAKAPFYISGLVLPYGFGYTSTTYLTPVIIYEDDGKYAIEYTDTLSYLNYRDKDSCFVNIRTNPACDIRVFDTNLTGYKLYFKNPVFVSDTFYIGCRVSTTCRWDDTAWMMTSDCAPASELDPITKWFYYDSIVYMVNGGSHSRLPIVPIISDPDTVVCPAVEDFAWTGRVDWKPVFDWTETGYDSTVYELCYGPYDQEVEQLRKVSTLHPPYTLADASLSPNVYYQARCRTRCHHVCEVHDTVSFTPWSDPVYFYIGDSMPDTSTNHGGHGTDPDPDTLGIATALQMDGARFTLTPNPTDGEVTVRVDGDGAELLAVTVRDMAGRVVLRTTTQHGICRIDTRGWPQGTYLVTVSTPNGSSTRKLEVAY